MKKVSDKYVPNAMSRATGDHIDCDIGSSLANRDAIVAGADHGLGYFHQVGLANVDSVSVGAFAGGHNCQAIDSHVVAASHVDVESHGVHQMKPRNSGVLHVVEI